MSRRNAYPILLKTITPKMFYYSGTRVIPEDTLFWQLGYNGKLDLPNSNTLRGSVEYNVFLTNSINFPLLHRDVISYPPNEEFVRQAFIGIIPLQMDCNTLEMLIEEGKYGSLFLASNIVNSLNNEGFHLQFFRSPSEYGDITLGSLSNTNSTFQALLIGAESTLPGIEV